MVCAATVGIVLKKSAVSTVTVSVGQKLLKLHGTLIAPGRAGLNEREAPGKVVTARPLKRLTQLSSVSHTLVSTL